ncbi:hypothetical protein [Synechococcus sp. BIOS-E4-1]|uniref:hypothetical protein n=1 Tax=Synechococcus sp. BIOS-E4-1 TaxID=1400864 RepID=UPI0016476A44|nr:hypothetical protein [Synechococcus sp. BIOS-E4-1]
MSDAEPTTNKEGNPCNSYIEAMSVYTLTTVTLLTELLLALRENNLDGFKHLLNLGLQELGLDVLDELTRDFLVPLLSEAESDRTVAWYWGLSL